MDWLNDVYFTHPFWIWVAIAAVFLVIEVSTGTGWLLWAAASAGVLAILTVIPGVPDAAAIHLAIWAALTIVSTLTARRYLPANVSGGGPDINDNIGRLVGKVGMANSPFHNGQGRVFIDGKEWAAVAEGADPLLEQRVEVLAAEGSVLRVKAS